MATFVALMTLLVLASCNTPCEKLLDKYTDKLNEIRRKCDCNFSIECDKNFPKSAAVGLTIRDNTGRVLIRLPENAEKDVLRHELVHAADRCARLCENALPTPAAAVGTRGQDIFDIQRALLCEFIAYRETRTFENDNIDHSRFPNPDDDDKAILSAYASVSDGLTSTLPPDELRELGKTLEAANLGPRQISSDSDTYKALKQRLIREANRIQMALSGCLSLLNNLDAK